MRAMVASDAPLQILPARLEDARLYAAYLMAHNAESGQDGAPPHALNRRNVEEIEELARERWRRPLSEPQWGRCWLLWTAPPPAQGPAGFHEQAARVVGEVELRGGRLAAEMHRATLGIGILGPFRGQRNGRRLMEAAIAWARDEAGLDYIDLGVFVGNGRAKRLYDSLGFVEVGVRADAFRVDGVSVDDIQMTLALRRSSGGDGG